MENGMHHAGGNGHRHKRRWAVLLAEVAVFAVAIAISVAAPAAAAAYKMYEEALAGRADLEAAAELAKKLDLSGANERLSSARAHLAAADRYGAALAPVTVLPFIGSDAKAARVLVRSSYETASGLSRIAALADGLASALASAGDFDLSDPTLRGGVEAFFRLPPPARRAELEKLASAPAELDSSLAEIDRALAGFNSLPSGGRFAQAVDSLKPVVAQLAAVRDRLYAANGLAKLLPELSGSPEPKKYLILIQNNTELRPTGGFIGTIGTVTIDAAEAKDLKLADVYAIDGAAGEKLATAPPAPLAKYLSVSKWYLRDANWSPDFPTAAQDIVRIYGQETGDGGIAGVVAVDPVFAEDLLRIVGNVKIGSSTFTPDNVTEEIEYQVEKGFSQKGIPVAQRKDVLVALSAEIFARVLALPPSGWQKVVDAMTEALDQKHILAVSFSDAANSFLASRNWNGALAPVDGDYLLAVDANLAALKTDSVITRSVSYSVSPAPEGGYVATAKLKYHNGGGFSWKTTRYRDYARVFVPAGSDLLSVRGAMENDKVLDPRRAPGRADGTVELGRRSFGAFISVEPGETKELVFTYRLPPALSAQIRQGSYKLTVQKQAGTVSVPLTLDLDFGKRVARAVPAEQRADWGDNAYHFSSDLTVDRRFEIGF